jgi:hypothetical protein
LYLSLKNKKLFKETTPIIVLRPPCDFPLPSAGEDTVDGYEHDMYTDMRRIQLEKLGVTLEASSPNLKLTPYPNPSPARGEGKIFKNSFVFYSSE